MSFDNAYKETMHFEGGYSFDPNDRGGETYRGISRKYNPTWAGWVTIDKHNPITNGAQTLYNDPILNEQVKTFYMDEYWLRPRFNSVDVIWEVLGEKLFDTGVNVGVGRASKWLQSTLNLLNRNQKYYDDITVDGGIGPKTIGTLQRAMNCNPKERILIVFAIHQGEHYKGIMERDKTQERFVGWFDRLTYK